MPDEKKVKKKGGIVPGAYVWVKDMAIAGSDLFTKGHVLMIDEKGKATVETTNGVKTQELVLPLSDCHPLCPGDDVPDHCQLMFLSQPTLLENTKVRYMADKIYTYVGEILVAVNPFRFIEGIYDGDKMAMCKGKKLWNTPPHVFAMSEKVRIPSRVGGASGGELQSLLLSTDADRQPPLRRSPVISGVCGHEENQTQPMHRRLGRVGRGQDGDEPATHELSRVARH